MQIQTTLAAPRGGQKKLGEIENEEWKKGETISGGNDKKQVARV